MASNFAKDVFRLLIQITAADDLVDLLNRSPPRFQISLHDCSLICSTENLQQC